MKKANKSPQHPVREISFDSDSGTSDIAKELDFDRVASPPKKVPEESHHQQEESPNVPLHEKLDDRQESILEMVMPPEEEMPQKRQQEEFESSLPSLPIEGDNHQEMSSKEFLPEPYESMSSKQGFAVDEVSDIQVDGILFQCYESMTVDEGFKVPASPKHMSSPVQGESQETVMDTATEINVVRNSFFQSRMTLEEDPASPGITSDMKTAAVGNEKKLLRKERRQGGQEEKKEELESLDGSESGLSTKGTETTRSSSPASSSRTSVTRSPSTPESPKKFVPEWASKQLRSIANSSPLVKAVVTPPPPPKLPEWVTRQLRKSTEDIAQTIQTTTEQLSGELSAFVGNSAPVVELFDDDEEEEDLMDC